MAVAIVYETHSTTRDNEAGIATGWLPGALSDEGRTQAAALGERRRADGVAAVFLDDLVDAPFAWREGWLYTLPDGWPEDGR